MITDNKSSFFNLYRHHFIRAAVAVPSLKVADPIFNAEESIALLNQAAEEQSLLVAFPELGLSGYSCDDLFQQQALLAECQQALHQILRSAQNQPIIGIVGLPLQIDSLLFNCAVVFYRGQILGVVPKTYLPNSWESYELRQFSPASYALSENIYLCGQNQVPFGHHFYFKSKNSPF